MTSRLRRAAASLAAVAGAALVLPATAGAAAPKRDANPCHSFFAFDLRCPKLSITAYDFTFDHTSSGRTLLRATSSLNSIGQGPIEFHGTRTGSMTMTAKQRIYRRDGSWITLKTGARLGFKAIPGQYRYWKLRDAARFELWSLDSSGNRVKLVRTGPKLYYCLRDLQRTRPRKGSPRNFVYPHCSQNPNQQKVTLGTSVGWSDIYPATYYEQWIDVTGLHGRFDYVLVADPTGVIYTSNTGPIQTSRRITLP